MSARLRAAVIGGSGFGKFHAQWHALEGAEVVAFSCSSDASVETSEGRMMDLTRQSPRGYADWGLMLRAERPQAVSVCTPPDRHAEPARAALESGAHVLCEKPLIFDAALSSEAMLSSARELLEAARQADRRLAVNLQYAAALEPYLQLYESRNGPLEDAETYQFEMESKGNRFGPIRHERIWTDLGPHALTPLLMRFPEATLADETIRATLSETEATAEMDFALPGGSKIRAYLRAGSCGKDAIPVRRFGFNGFLVDVLTARDEAGLFQTLLRNPDSGEERLTEDLMRISIRQFLRAVQGRGAPLVAGEEAVRNLEAMLSVWERMRDR
jgi:predicted dehydrogenase